MSENVNNAQEPTEEKVEKKSFGKKIDNFFGISKRGSTFRIEIVAGIVTFLAMCYILTVNPNQFFFAGKLVPNPDFGVVENAPELIPSYTPTHNPMWSSVFMATAFGAFIGTLLMAFLSKLPLAQAPGMGLNSLVGSIIGGGIFMFADQFNFTLANAMLMVLISGVLFVFLSAVQIKGKSLRQLIFDGIPNAVKKAIPVGIGLFIAFIGFQNAGVIVANQYTLVDLVPFSDLSADVAQSASVCLIGLVVIAVLSHLKVKGAIIFGILFATLIGIPLGVTNYEAVLGEQAGISWKFWENFKNYFVGENSVVAICFTDGFSFPSGSVFTVIMLIITMCMIDMFDTMGTCVGCCSAAGLLDEKGTPLNYNKIMYADSIATCVGAVMGTSTVTTFVESGAGIAAGGKTGLTALTTAILFFLSIFLLPVFAMIPSAAAASALVYVGVLMMKGVKDIDFSDIRTAVPAFLAIAIMPLAYSITKGIGMAILSYVVITLIAYIVDMIKYAASKDENKEKPAWEISIVTMIISALFIVYFFVPTVL